jgi:hypothetical protein
MEEPIPRKCTFFESYLQAMLLATRLCPGPKVVRLYGEFGSSIYQGWWLAVWKLGELINEFYPPVI